MVEISEGAASYKDFFSEGIGSFLSALRTYNVLSQAFLLANTPRGDGRPVMMIPGLICHDVSLWPLRGMLELMNYSTHDWKLGFNLGPVNVYIERAEERLKQIYEQSGQRRVTIIGQSLGGAIAIALAQRQTHMVDRCITLGSPVNPHTLKSEGQTIIKPAEFLFKAMNPMQDPRTIELSEAVAEFMANLDQYEIPAHFIHSMNDGVVGAWASLNPVSADFSDNLEIRAPHMSMGFNKVSQFAIGRILSLEEGEMQPFDYERYPTIFPQEPFYKTIREGDVSLYASC